MSHYVMLADASTEYKALVEKKEAELWEEFDEATAVHWTPNSLYEYCCSLAGRFERIIKECCEVSYDDDESDKESLNKCRKELRSLNAWCDPCVGGDGVPDYYIVYISYSFTYSIPDAYYTILDMDSIALLDAMNNVFVTGDRNLLTVIGDYYIVE